MAEVSTALGTGLQVPDVLTQHGEMPTTQTAADVKAQPLPGPPAKGSHGPAQGIAPEQETKAVCSAVERLQGDLEVQQTRVNARFAELADSMRGLEGRLAMVSPTANDWTKPVQALAENLSQVCRWREEIEPLVRELQKSTDVQGKRLETAIEDNAAMRSAMGVQVKEQAAELVDLRDMLEGQQGKKTTSQLFAQELAEHRAEHSSRLQQLEVLAQNMSGMLKDCLHASNNVSQAGAVVATPSVDEVKAAVSSLAETVGKSNSEVAQLHIAVESLAATVAQLRSDAAEESGASSVKHAEAAQALQELHAQVASSSTKRLEKETDGAADEGYKELSKAFLTLGTQIETRAASLEQELHEGLEEVRLKLAAVSSEERLTSHVEGLRTFLLKEVADGHARHVDATLSRQPNIETEVDAIQQRVEAQVVSHLQAFAARMDATEQHFAARIQTETVPRSQDGESAVAGLSQRIEATTRSTEAYLARLQTAEAQCRTLTQAYTDLEASVGFVKQHGQSAREEMTSLCARVERCESLSGELVARTNELEVRTESTLHNPLAYTMPLSEQTTRGVNMQADHGQTDGLVPNHIALIREWMDLIRQELANTSAGVDEKFGKLADELRREMVRGVQSPIALDLEHRLQGFEKEWQHVLRNGLEQVQSEVLAAFRKELHEVDASGSQNRLEAALRTAQAEGGARDRRLWELEVQLRRHIEACQRLQSFEEPLAGLVQGVLKMGEHLGVTPEDSSITALSSDWRSVCVQLPLLVDRACLHSKLPRHTVLVKLLRQKLDACGDGQPAPPRTPVAPNVVNSRKEKRATSPSGQPCRAWQGSPATVRAQSSGGHCRGRAYHNSGVFDTSVMSNTATEVQPVEQPEDLRETPPHDWRTTRHLRSAPRLPPQLGTPASPCYGDGHVSPGLTQQRRMP